MTRRSGRLFMDSPSSNARGGSGAARAQKEWRWLCTGCLEAEGARVGACEPRSVHAWSKPLRLRRAWLAFTLLGLSWRPLWDTGDPSRLPRLLVSCTGHAAELRRWQEGPSPLCCGRSRALSLPCVFLDQYGARARGLGVSTSLRPRTGARSLATVKPLLLLNVKVARPCKIELPQ